MVNKVSEIYNGVIKLYQSELKPIADKLEKKRKIYALVYKIFTGIFFLVIFGLILGCVVLFASEEGHVFWGNIFGGIAAIVFLLCSFLWSLRTIIFNYYASEVKSELFSKIYKSLDNNLTYIPGGFKLPVSMYGLELFLADFGKRNESFILKQQIQKLKVLPGYDYLRIDDVILGTYQGHEVQIIEFSLIEKRVYRSSKGGRRVEYVEIFHGALFQTSMEKHVKANVFFKQKGSNLVCPSVLKRIKLESNEFEKIFETYSHDEIEARYFLTTAMMEKLIEVNNSGQKISGYVCGNSVNILIHATKDMFEPDINKPLNNPNNYFELIFQAKSMLDMITQLNLESQTGL